MVNFSSKGFFDFFTNPCFSPVVFLKYQSGLLGRTWPYVDRSSVHLSMWTTDQNLGSDHLIDGFGRQTKVICYRWTADEQGPSTSWTDSDDRPLKI